MTKPRDIDPADWWAVMSKRFDEVFPELLHVTVHIDEGKTVAALAFTTDLSPYVITTGAEEGRVEREVPIRVATATRSAHRHDLIRMLAPVVTVPQAFPSGSPCGPWYSINRMIIRSCSKPWCSSSTREPIP